MSQRRLSITLLLANAGAVLALALPGMASAAYEHPTNTEAGVAVYPEHLISKKTREQVKAETEAAMREGRLSFGESNFPMAPTVTGPGRTREEVLQELHNETPAAHEARNRAMAG